MRAFSGSGPVPYQAWLCGAIAMSMTACATSPWTEEGQPSGVQREDAQPVRYRTLAEMLSQIPGVRVIERPGGRITVRISGTSSFLGGQEPLFLLDGMVIQSSDGGLSSINPNSIESIRVLKDASETAIYGARGANGVIVIKTKTGVGAELRLFQAPVGLDYHYAPPSRGLRS